jgi:GNAT superfamily N-acetyltransferase
MNQNNQSPVVIRLAAPDDAAAIAELHVRSWQHAYRDLLPESYLQGIATPENLERRTALQYEAITKAPEHERRWVAVRDGQIAGFAITATSRDPDASPGTAEVEALYLSPGSIGKGIGRALFFHVVEDLRRRGFTQATLWVLKGNARARKFYESAGWLPDGQSKVEERPGGVVLHEVRYHTML